MSNGVSTLGPGHQAGERPTPTGPANLEPDLDGRSAADQLLQRLGEQRVLVVLLALALISHAYNMFRYPPYLGDEGIYMEQAWAVLREGQLSPYTYWYDHSPAGWIFIAWWVLLLPAKFNTFGMAINSGRVLMLIVHLVSVVLLYRITLKLSQSLVAATITVLIFSLSPLSLYYQRMVLLDNIMVFWLLLAIHLVLTDRNRLMTIVGSGTAFSLSVLTKENAIFFGPILGYMLYQRVRHSYRRRFALVGWLSTVSMIVSLYPLYAFLKTELLPPGIDYLFTSAPAERVSLLATLLWQLGRKGGSVFDPYSQFWFFFWTKWWAKDQLILLLGATATLLNLALALRRKPRDDDRLIVAALAISFALYLMRGSVMLQFYVVPILGFLALNVGLAASWLIRQLPDLIGGPAYGIVLLTLLVAFTGGSHDHYLLDLTSLQARQLASIRATVPRNAVLIVDDDLWVDLHEAPAGAPSYRNAHSHWKAQGDPAIRDKLLRNDPGAVDYLVMSDDLLDTFNEVKADLPLAVYGRSETIARFIKGDVLFEVRKVKKSDR